MLQRLLAAVVASPFQRRSWDRTNLPAQSGSAETEITRLPSGHADGTRREPTNLQETIGPGPVKFTHLETLQRPTDWSLETRCAMP
jgi:hypothetical protein